nr:MAG TPA: hypothetical protein [Caudoviricetes sp.]
MLFLFANCKEITNFALEKRTKTVKDMKNQVENIAAWIISMALVIMLFIGGNLIYFGYRGWGWAIVFAMVAVIARTFQKLGE